jgi:hypothetical protein
MTIARFINDRTEGLLRAMRRLDRFYRNGFDDLFRPAIVAVAQFFINLLRNDPVLGIAEERALPEEEAVTREITARMSAFLVKHYTGKVALRAGNTKTHGLLRASFEVAPDLPPELRRGVFASPRAYPAWVRLAGPGPFAPADLDDNGILSMSIKLMGVEGEKLLDDERMTQDFTGISAPTFTTPNVVENLKLQKQIGRGTPVMYFLNPLDSHFLDAVMQGVYSRAHANPLELRFFSCVPYLHGEGQAVQYSIRPSVARRSRVPRRPGPNYLREAMASTLREREVCFDFLVQLQTDPRRMPVENSSVIWPKKLSPYRKVATLRIPIQEFDSPEQLAFDRFLSFNPWHSLPEHRPLGNQGRARKRIYLELSRFRQGMNGDRRIEPTGEEQFPRPPLSGRAGQAGPTDEPGVIQPPPMAG